MLEIAELVVSYGSSPVLYGVDIAAEDGTITSVIGANGAGKSTLLKTIIGVCRCSSGRIVFRDRDLTGLRTSSVVQSGVCLIPEGRRLFSGMSVRENLLLGACLERSDSKRLSRLDRIYDYFPVLHEKRSARAGNLSGGQQQMLAIGRGLMSDPKLLMLDEPCSGLAPIVVQEIASILGTMCDDGVSILLVEQNAVFALDVSQYSYVLENGRVVLSGRSADVRSSEAVSRAYLGGDL